MEIITENIPGIAPKIKTGFMFVGVMSCHRECLFHFVLIPVKLSKKNRQRECLRGKKIFNVKFQLSHVKLMKKIPFKPRRYHFPTKHSANTTLRIDRADLVACRAWKSVMNFYNTIFVVILFFVRIRVSHISLTTFHLSGMGSSRIRSFFKGREFLE